MATMALVRCADAERWKLWLLWNEHLWLVREVTLSTGRVLDLEAELVRLHLERSR